MEESSFIFTTPFRVNIVEVKGKEKVFLEGMISTTDMDLVNDVVTKTCLISMQKQILEKNIKLDIEHEAFRGESLEEKEINKTKIPAGRIIDATVEEMGDNRFGLRVKAELNNFNQRFDEIKGNVIERFLDAYSIAFIPTKTAHMEDKGIVVRLLDDVRLLNVALTGNPINTAAQNTKIFMKAIDAVEEYKKEKKNNPEIEGKLEVKSNNHVSDNKLNYGGLKMEKDEPQGTSGEPGAAPATPEEPVDKPTDEPVDKPTDKPEDKPAEEPAPEEKAIDFKSELKTVNDKVESLGKELAEIKEILKKPIHKSISETKAPAEEKASNPLDLIQ